MTIHAQNYNRPQLGPAPQVYLQAGWWTLAMLEPVIAQLQKAKENPHGDDPRDLRDTRAGARPDDLGGLSRQARDEAALVAENAALKAQVEACARHLTEARQQIQDLETRVGPLGCGSRQDLPQSDAPLVSTDAERPEKSCEWAVVNCHVLARRELRRLGQQTVSPTAPRPDPLSIERWEHIRRMCERAGATSKGVLRASLPTEITDGSDVLEARGPFPQLKLVYEYVHHLDGCPSIGGNGDQDCTCGVVNFLRWVERQQSQPADSPVAASARAGSHQKRTVCLNCGETENGGYETEDVGPFCGECWSLLETSMTQPFRQHAFVASRHIEDRDLCEICGDNQTARVHEPVAEARAGSQELRNVSMASQDALPERGTPASQENIL